MTTQIGVGHSNHRNPEEAGRQAAAAAMTQASISACDFVMMFATVGYDQQAIVNAVRKVTKDAPLSGCSGEGVITQNVGNESNHAVTVLVWKSEDMKFRNVRATGLKTGSAGVGGAIAKELGPIPEDARALFILADGLTFNFDQFQDGFSSAVKLAAPLKFIGGNAGDNYTQTKTYQYHNGEVFSEGVSCALLCGKGDVFVAVSHGCTAIGGERTITKAEGNVIYEIDGKPALDVMNEYLSTDEIKNFQLSMISLSLGFRAPKELASASGDEYIIRVIPSKDDDKRSISIYTDVTPGTKVWMTRRDPEKMLKSADDVVATLKQQMGDQQAKGILHFECMGRGKHMFREEEKMQLLERMQTGIGKQVPWAGFYCYGEIAPVAGKNYLHNYTSVIAALT